MDLATQARIKELAEGERHDDLVVVIGHLDVGGAELAAETVTAEYDLEYGSNTVEMHRDAVAAGDRVVIVDDLLATGGTTRATIDLVEQLDGEVVALAFLIELTELGAREYLEDYNIITLIKY